MAYLVETMMYVGKEPCHGLGRSIPEGKRPSIREAIVAAGLHWEVELRHLYTENRRGRQVGIVNQSAVCRKKDDSVLGIVGCDYAPPQNSEAFAWFQPFLDTGDVTIETAGSLTGGSLVPVIATYFRQQCQKST